MYSSSTREPLGKSYIRGHKIPDGLGVKRPFGIVNGAKVRVAVTQTGCLVASYTLDNTNHGLFVAARDHKKVLRTGAMRVYWIDMRAGRQSARFDSDRIW